MLSQRARVSVLGVAVALVAVNVGVAPFAVATPLPVGNALAQTLGFNLQAPFSLNPSSSVENAFGSLFHAAEDTNGGFLKNCGVESDLIKIDSVAISPDPPQKGVPITVKGSGSLSEEVTGGTLEVNVKLKLSFGSIGLANIKLDLCEYSAKIDHPCPISAGEYDIDRSFEIPAEVPSGTYEAHVRVVSDNGQQIACLDGTTTF